MTTDRIKKKILKALLAPTSEKSVCKWNFPWSLCHQLVATNRSQKSHPSGLLHGRVFPLSEMQRIPEYYAPQGAAWRLIAGKTATNISGQDFEADIFHAFQSCLNFYGTDTMFCSEGDEVAVYHHPYPGWRRREAPGRTKAEAHTQGHVWALAPVLQYFLSK